VTRVVYRDYRPGPALRPFVERLWLLEGPAEAIDGEPIPPDGRPEIIVHGGDPCLQIMADGSAHRQARVLLAGQLTRAIRIVPRGHARIAGAHLRPHGAYDLLRVSQHQFRDRVVDLRSIDARLARVVRERVAAEVDGDRMVEALDRVLAGRAAGRLRTAEAAEAATMALAMKGLIDVAGLARATRLSARQLERHFRERIGISPKLFLRIVRFQEVLRATRSRTPDIGWAAVAAEHGFYDQAHFINDFKAFVGRTPGDWNITQDSMAAIFSAVRRVAV
jgi:AraC-like DNA-binding protein